jgi:hypothetical protein
VPAPDQAFEHDGNHSEIAESDSLPSSGYTQFVQWRNKNAGAPLLVFSVYIFVFIFDPGVER